MAETVNPPDWLNLGLSGVPLRDRPAASPTRLSLDGTVCWQQPQQVLNAITKSDGCGDETAALQLFEHLEGEALNVALLMPEGERAFWSTTILREG